MTEQTELDFEKPDNDAELLQKLFDRADRILIKKLSNNDRDWARYENKHQAGVYIPHEQRDGGFFPTLMKSVNVSSRPPGPKLTKSGKIRVLSITPARARKHT